MTAFESLIESKVEDSHERLYFVGQYTSGKAKEIINRCLQRRLCSRDFVVETKLCFGCFSDQHIAKHCKER